MKKDIINNDETEKLLVDSARDSGNYSDNSHKPGHLPRNRATADTSSSWQQNPATPIKINLPNTGIQSKSPTCRFSKRDSYDDESLENTPYRSDEDLEFSDSVASTGKINMWNDYENPNHPDWQTDTSPSDNFENESIAESNSISRSVSDVSSTDQSSYKPGVSNITSVSPFHEDFFENKNIDYLAETNNGLSPERHKEFAMENILNNYGKSSEGSKGTLSSPDASG